MAGLNELGSWEPIYGWSDRAGNGELVYGLSERATKWVRVESLEVMVCLSDWIFFM